MAAITGIELKRILEGKMSELLKARARASQLEEAFGDSELQVVHYEGQCALLEELLKTTEEKEGK